MLSLVLLLALAAPVPAPKPALTAAQVAAAWDLLAEAANPSTDPQQWEVDLLPPYEVCKEQYYRAVDHQAWVEWQLRWDEGMPAEETWEAWRIDAIDRVRIWEAACSARYHEGHLWGRPALAYLHWLVGEPAWYAGQMPAPVPLWRYLPQ